MVRRFTMACVLGASIAGIAACGGDGPQTTSGTGGRDASSSSSGDPSGSQSASSSGAGGDGGAGGEGGAGGSGGGSGGAGGSGSGSGGAGGSGSGGGSGGAGGVGGGSASSSGSGSGGAGGVGGGSASSSGSGGGDGGAGGGLPATCADALDLNDPAVATKVGSTTTYSGTTQGSTVTGFGDPTCSDGTAGVPTVVHRYQTGAGASQLHIETVEAAGALADTVVWAYLDCLDTASELACDDDSGASSYSALNTPVVPSNTPVFIAVAGYDAASVGPYTLRVTETPVTVVPSSGTCAAPTAAGPGSYAGETLAGDANTLASDACFTGSQAPEAVYAITLASKSDLVAVASPGAPLLDLGVYLRASPCASGAELACAEADAAGAPETLSIKDLAAGTYYIAVDGYTSLDYGPYGLSLSLVGVLPAGAMCDPASSAARCESGTVCIGPAGGAGCSVPSVLLAEDFTSNLGPFTAVDAGGDGLTWLRCDELLTCQNTNTTGSASAGAFAFVKDDNNVAHDGEALVSPAINAASATYVALTFDHAFDHLEGASDLARVDVSLDQMAWTPVATYTADASGHVVLDISSIAAGKTFYVRFFFDDQTGGGPSWVNDWRVDDVRVLGF